MRGPYNETIARLEEILLELECEFLYLISDLSTDAEENPGSSELPIGKLEIARHCLSVAAKALQQEPAKIAEPV
jgi:hypothetical protein